MRFGDRQKIVHRPDLLHVNAYAPTLADANQNQSASVRKVELRHSSAVRFIQERFAEWILGKPDIGGRAVHVPAKHVSQNCVGEDVSEAVRRTLKPAGASTLFGAQGCCDLLRRRGWQARGPNVYFRRRQKGHCPHLRALTRNSQLT